MVTKNGPDKVGWQRKVIVKWKAPTYTMKSLCLYPTNVVCH